MNSNSKKVFYDRWFEDWFKKSSFFKSSKKSVKLVFDNDPESFIKEVLFYEGQKTKENN